MELNAPAFYASGPYPILELERDIQSILADLRGRGWNMLEFHVDADGDPFTAFWNGMQSVFPYDIWGGSGWDSFGEAARDILELLPMHTGLVIHGYGEYLRRHPREALKNLVNLIVVFQVFYEEDPLPRLPVIFADEHWEAKSSNS